MDNIVDLMKEKHVNDQPAPTEKSQIVIAYISPQPALILRFSSVKKGEKEYDKIKKAWTLFTGPWEPKKKQPPYLHDVDGDMFVSIIDLGSISSVSFVDHVKRAKFIPL